MCGVGGMRFGGCWGGGASFSHDGRGFGGV